MSNSDTLLKPGQLRIDTYAENAYLQYAMATVKDRALAQIADGEKPVHRRILYAMRQLGLTSDAKPVKSARIVGDVLGKYHPHGDMSVYDAMVRMAQPFSLRYPLIFGQGNFGSRDGDSAAAMRYTEARLAPISKLLLDELAQGTVDFKPNYDASQQEPTRLPTRLPFTLLNGSIGIAVGMASNIPPHNLREVCAAALAVLKDENVSIEELMTLMPGPDFPDGGQIISSTAEIQAAYTTGRGPIKVRARWVKEDLARNQWQIVVTELPYLVSTKAILGQLDTLSNPQIPEGKKVLSQQQINLKALALDFLENARDESGKDADVRIVLTPRTAKVDSDAMMAFLCSNTSLETSFGINMNMLGLDGSPATKNLLDQLKEWCTFRVATVKRRTEHELANTAHKIEILSGRLAVFNNLDAVIRVIRESDAPIPELQKSFGLSYIQAEDVLEMKLRQLNRLEGVKLENDLRELRELSSRLVALLADASALRALVSDEIRADCTKYADDRRTLIKAEASSSATSTALTVLNEPVTLVVSKNLWVRAYRGIGLAKDSFVFKTSDSLAFTAEGTTTLPLIVLDDKGRVYSFSVAEIPLKGEGAPLSTFIDIQEGAKPLALLCGSGEDTYLFSKTSGAGYIASLKNLWAKPKSGKSFQDIEVGELPLSPLKVPVDGSGYIVAISSEGKVLAFALTEVMARPSGGKGVVLMGLDAATLTKLIHTSSPGITLGAVSPSGAATTVALEGEEWLKYVGKRARKGALLPKKLRPS